MVRSGKSGGTKRLAKRRERRRKPGSHKTSGKINLYGLHTVRAAIENPRRRIHSIKCTQNALTRLQSAFAKRESAYKRKPEVFAGPSSVNVETVETNALNALTGPEAVHQGVVAICEPLPMLDGSELFQLAHAKLLLVLDQITDPHNAGAILRSAGAMGVDAVLVTYRNSTAETAVLAKSASGALDMVDLVDIRNMSKAITELNGMSFATIGLDSEGRDSLESELENAQGCAVALVLGSEGRGLREKTREACTALARLDMPGRIKSLNVSNAAALSLYLASRAIASAN